MMVERSKEANGINRQVCSTQLMKFLNGYARRLKFGLLHLNGCWLRVTNFELKWMEVKPECIKAYLLKKQKLAIMSLKLSALVIEKFTPLSVQMASTHSSISSSSSSSAQRNALTTTLISRRDKHCWEVETSEIESGKKQDGQH